MQRESPFDNSVCCVFTRSICTNWGIIHLICILCPLCALTGAIMNIAYLGSPTIVSVMIYQIGLVLHFTSLGMCMFLNSYFGRYLTSTKNDLTERYNSVPVYIMTVLYWFFCMIYLAMIADSHNANRYIERISTCSQGFVIYFASSLVLWYWSVVFKPFIPNLFYALKVDSARFYLPLDDARERRIRRYGCFVNAFINELFYEQHEDINAAKTYSSASLLTVLCISIAYMNASYAMYYVDSTYYIIMVTLTTSSVLTALVLLSLIVFAYYKGSDVIDNDSNKMWELCKIAAIILGSWLFASFFVAGTVLTEVDGKWQWAIDPVYPITSMVRNIFYIIQASPLAIILLTAIIIGCYYLGKMCNNCCCVTLPQQLHNARNEVAGYQITVDQMSD